MSDLLSVTPSGLYCEAGGFYIDPWRPVERAVVTHAHSDHARPGSKRYLCSSACAPFVRLRCGEESAISCLEFGERRTINGVTLSLHPAGHILGSAQVRVEHQGEVWVVTGDYKTEPDPTVEPFELVRCHTLITECTFGLPVYRWPEALAEFERINAWWAANQSAGRTSVLMGYSLGKAQRLLAGVDAGLGPIFAHGAVLGPTQAYRDQGIRLPPVRPVSEAPLDVDWPRALVVAPPGAEATPWMRRFRESATAFASGWMAVRGIKRRRGVERGFVISDHVDWPALMEVVAATGASRVLTTHGYSAVVAKHLSELGLDSSPLETQFRGEAEEEGA